MKRITSLLFSLCVVVICINAQKANMDSLYDCLDKAIDNSDQYMNKKNKEIDALKLRYKSAESELAQYYMCMNLYDAYHATMNDSALMWIDRGIETADKMHRPDLKARASVTKASQYAASGFYEEALSYLNSVPKSELKDSIATEYYYTFANLYGEMAYYTKDNKMKLQYFEESDKYREMFYGIVDHNSILYIWKRSTQLCNIRRYKEAMQLNDIWLKRVKPDTHDFAIVAFFRSEIYKGMNNENMRKYWLAESALCDIRCAVMDQSSLWSLAEIVNKEGDVDRSYKYVEYSWRCISTFSTHMREWLVSPVLTMISGKYREKVKTANTRLSVMAGAVSLLSLFLLVSLISMAHKKKQLRVARNKLSETNSELASLNGQLKVANEELSTVNRRLNESNIVKDEYIGKFLSICSTYIDKLDNYRIKVNRRVKANQFKELLRITNSQQLKEDELKELFDNFDSVFLRIFPNFVNDFNALLEPESRIMLTDDKHLTTDLRIFALIRLGINESSRIAEFLRYSPNSIYNYRARIKKHVLCEREDFEKRVKEIGMEMKQDVS